MEPYLGYSYLHWQHPDNIFPSKKIFFSEEKNGQPFMPKGKQKSYVPTT
jgi:hypothetical protein